MATLALIVAGVLALVVAALFAALIELYKDIQQLRDAVGLLDRPMAVALGRMVGARPSNVGLPRALDDASAALVLFLSDRCGTCRQLANGLSHPLVEQLWLVLEARSPESGTAFLSKYRLNDDPQVVSDFDGAIAHALGLETTPVAFRIEHGRFVSASTVPSSRQLNASLPKVIRLKQVV
jgi:hypothetical protein